MKQMKFKKIVGLACFSFMAMPMSLLASTMDEKAPSCFFVQSADEAVLKSGELTLINPNINTVWFANSPSTKTGVMPTSHYLSLLWGNPSSHFNKHHPNAAFVGSVINPVTHESQRVDVIMTLDKLTEQNHHLVYQVHSLLYQGSLIDLKKTVYLQNPTLFIDKYICTTCT